MAYADSIRITNPTFENVASLIDGQILSFSTVGVDTGATPTSFTSGGYLTACDRTVTVAAGESVLLLAFITFTNGTINNNVTLRIREDTNTIHLSAYGYGRAFRANTDGLDQMLSTHVVRTPAAGSHTYQLFIEPQASSTAYVRFGYLSVIKFRTS
jgi:hypothetical protein